MIVNDVTWPFICIVLFTFEFFKRIIFLQFSRVRYELFTELGNMKLLKLVLDIDSRHHVASSVASMFDMQYSSKHKFERHLTNTKYFVTENIIFFKYFSFCPI